MWYCKEEGDVPHSMAARGQRHTYAVRKPSCCLYCLLENDLVSKEPLDSGTVQHGVCDHILQMIQRGEGSMVIGRGRSHVQSFEKCSGRDNEVQVGIDPVQGTCTAGMMAEDTRSW